MELSRYEEALQAYDQALKINPNSDEAIKGREKLLIKLSEGGNGTPTVTVTISPHEVETQKATTSSSDEENTDTAQDWIDIGKNLYQQGEYDKAVKSYNQALKIDPKNADAQIGLDAAESKLNN